MNTAELLPAPTRPPHDPYRLPLDKRAGWRIGIADDVEPSPLDGALVITADPGSGRQLNEASGSFGGLTTPPNVAVAVDHSVFLLNWEKGELMRFDPCRCRFDTVPCLGGFGSAPRQVAKPPVDRQSLPGIGVCGGNLFIADSGNRRLAIFSLYGFALRGFWYPPEEETSAPWLPVDVSFDERGNVLVADPANGCIHVFNPAGRWLRCISGVGAVRAIVTDCDDRVFVHVSPLVEVKAFDVSSGEALGTRVKVEEIADRFATLPFSVTAEGYLNLSALCLDSSMALFDAEGNRRTSEPPPTAKTFAGQATYLSEALDSQLYRCQWDRVSLDAVVPDGTRISVFTYTAETELSLAQIQNLDADAWATSQTAFPGQLNADWDCLIRSEGGRYLWLKLELKSDGISTPRIRRVVIDFPRISLRRYLPAVFGQEPVSADFTDRFLEVFDRGFRGIEGQLDRLAGYFDPLSAPAERGRRDFLGWLASWIGVVLDRRLPTDRQRRIVKEAGKLFPLRGTVCGLRRFLELFLGLDRLHCGKRPSCGPCTTREPSEWQPPRLVLEHFKLRRWLFLGAGRLGDEAKLWGQKIVNRTQLSGPQTDGNAQLGVTQLITTQDPFRDPFHVYAHRFSVFVPGWLGRSEQRRKSLERLIEAEKPAHTAHQLVFVEPRFRIGVQSMIGFDSVIGCYPEGVILNESALGKATVLGPDHEGGPELRGGVDSRIGSTTLIT